jgi:DNA-binding MltR family transcriptional regulator
MSANNEATSVEDGPFNKLIDKMFEDHPGTAADFKSSQLFRQEIEKETDRGMVLFGVSRLEILLKDLIEKRLAGGKKHIASLFDFNGPLGTFSSKIAMAYSLGLIPKSMRTELDILRKLRNEFAHSDQAIDFKTGSIAAICKKLSYVIQPPVPADRMRTAYIVSLLYVYLQGELKRTKTIEEQKDYFDGGSKKMLEQLINNIRVDIERLLRTVRKKKIEGK